MESAPVRAAPAADASAPKLVAGKLAPKLATTTVYPTSVCVHGAELVFENYCGCNDALLCHLDRATATTLAFSLTTDPTRMNVCDDCFAMVPAHCALPPGDRWIVEINRQLAFELDKPVDGTCFTESR